MARIGEFSDAGPPFIAFAMPASSLYEHRMPLTDFFIASMQELRAACPGWKDPFRNP
jgi:hypothetical protein